MATIALSACSAISAGAASSGAQSSAANPAGCTLTARASKASRARSRDLSLAAEPADRVEHRCEIAVPRRRGTGTQACARESGVAIARIGDERLALGGKRRGQARLWNAEQRAQNTATIEFADRRHPGEAGVAAVRGAADQVGLGLIFAVMRGQQMQAAMLAAPLGEQSIAGLPRRLLNSGRRLFPLPDQDFVSDFPGRQPAAEPADLGAALRPQPMVDAQRADLAPARARPAIRQNGEREAVGAARDGDGDKRGALKTGETVERAAKLGDAQRLRGGSRAQHPSRFFSCAARSLMALPECGNAWSSCISAMQALCFWLARSSDIPSFSRPSGAFGPFG